MDREENNKIKVQFIDNSTGQTFGVAESKNLIHGSDASPRGADRKEKTTNRNASLFGTGEV